jgi:hypothetical protein
LKNCSKEIKETAAKVSIGILKNFGSKPSGMEKMKGREMMRKALDIYGIKLI